MVKLVAFENYEKIDASDFDEAAGLLFQLSEYLGNTQVPMLAAKDIAVEDMHVKFNDEIEPSGYKWFELSSRYAARRGSEHPILDTTGSNLTKKNQEPQGTLRKEATNPKAFSVDAQSLWFSTDQLPEYWAVHQYGSDDMKPGSTAKIDPVFEPRFVKGKGMVRVRTSGRTIERNQGVEIGQGIPPRPFIGLTEDAEDKIIDIFDRWIDTGFDYVDRVWDERPTKLSIGDTYSDKSYRVGTITSVAPGSHGKPQFRVSGKGFGGRFGPMVS